MIKEIFKEIESEFKKEYEKAYAGILPVEILREGNPWFINFLKSSIIKVLERLVDREENTKQEKSEKCSHCGGSGDTMKCQGGSDWAIKDAYNESKSDTISFLKSEIDLLKDNK